MRTLERFEGKVAGNYCTLPTVDVEILEDAPRCAKCRKPLERRGRDGVVGEFDHVEFDDWVWVHAGSGDSEVDSGLNASGRPYVAQRAAHYVSPATRCSYCGSQDPAEVKFVRPGWADQVVCSRCGGIWGFGLGD